MRNVLWCYSFRHPTGAIPPSRSCERFCERSYAIDRGDPMQRPCFAAPTLARILSSLALLLVMIPGRAAGAQALTLEQIMADPDWIGTPPENPYWADDGSAVYFERKRTG